MFFTEPQCEEGRPEYGLWMITTSHTLSSRDKQGLTDNVIDDYKGMLGTFEWQHVTPNTFLSTLNT